jgi:Domain of unknown function (DUF4202)
MMNAENFQVAIQRIDQANAADPRRVMADGTDWPHELLYAMRMTAWLERLYPDASEPLRLAVRAQHIRRWMIPRASYPMDRAGYLRWRADLSKFHAEQAGQIMRDVGYDDTTSARVQSLLRKENLKADADTQALEDVAALVFLQVELSDFAKKHAGQDEKLVRILQRTWKKMSPRGRQAATGLEVASKERRLFEMAIQSDAS